MPTVDLRHGDCLDILKTLPDGSVDAVVTDPPAAIGFMGKSWDGDKGGRERWVAWLAAIMSEARRVSRPGAYALVWALPRTSHWAGTAIEDAGWRIVDRVAHVFGSGFPKHKSKLKPAVEDWWLAWNPDRKATPLPGIDACRVAAPDGLTSGGRCVGSSPMPMSRAGSVAENRDRSEEHPAGRWPPNLLLSHHPDCDGSCVDGCPVRLMGEQGGERTSGAANIPAGVAEAGSWRHMEGRTDPRVRTVPYHCEASTGSAARFYPNFRPDADPFLYCPKASRRDRNEGCEGLPKGVAGGMKGRADGSMGSAVLASNTHPTVKPTDLMRWLVRLVAAPGDTVLDCFAGSGSTGKACALEGMNFVGIEQDAEYVEIARRRIDAALSDAPLFSRG